MGVKLQHVRASQMQKINRLIGSHRNKVQSQKVQKKEVKNQFQKKLHDLYNFHETGALPAKMSSGNLVIGPPRRFSLPGEDESFKLNLFFQNEA